MTSRPLVLLTADVKVIDGYTFHAVNELYSVPVAEVSGCLPLLLPPMSDRIAIDDVLDQADGVLATGSRSNVHPTHYGVAETEETEPHDPERDDMTLPLIRAAIDRGTPLLAICRGIQELNVALGGTLLSEVQTHEGRMDHRASTDAPIDERFALKHSVAITEGGCLGRIVDADAIQVNSFHRQAIGRLADRLLVEAVAEDGTIEAVSVKDAPGFAMGVQWHPEYWAKTDPPSRAIFEAFGDAARSYHARRGIQAAAE